MSKVQRIAPYVQGESLALTQGPYTYAITRAARSASGEVWELWDDTKLRLPHGSSESPPEFVGTISVVYDEGGVMNLQDVTDTSPITSHARVTVALAIQVDADAIRAYLARLLLLLGIRGEVQVYDSARHLGYLIRD